MFPNRVRPIGAEAWVARVDAILARYVGHHPSYRRNHRDDAIAALRALDVPLCEAGNWLDSARPKP